MATYHTNTSDMNQCSREPFHMQILISPVHRVILFTIAAAFAANAARAQVVFGPPRITSDTASTPSATAATTSGHPGSLSKIQSSMANRGPLAQWGPVAFRPYTDFSFQYGNGILRVPGEPVNSSRYTLTQGLLFDLGKTWTLDAGLTRSAYSSKLLDDTYDTSLALSGRWNFEIWSLSLTQAYATNSPIVVETGGQNAERTSRTSASITLHLGDRTSVDTTATWSTRLANPELQNASWTGSDWDQLSLSSWLNYLVTSKMSFSLGALVGHDNVGTSSDMSYIQPQGKIKWNPTTKLSFNAGGGVEFRTVDGKGGKDIQNPVYNIGASYSPTLTTTLSINASRSVSNSYFNDQTIRGTNAGVNLSQRIAQRFFVNVGFAHGSSDYDATTNLFITDRTDKYTAYNGSISTIFWGRGALSVSYGYSRNSSNDSNFQYASKQIGANIGYRF